MKKGEKKIWKWTVEVHKMEWLYPYVRLEDFMKVCKWLEEENQKLKSEWVVIGWEDHKNYIDMEEYMKLKREKEELEKEVERLQKVLYTITWSLDDGEPDLYEDVEWDLC